VYVVDLGIILEVFWVGRLGLQLVGLGHKIAHVDEKITGAIETRVDVSRSFTSLGAVLSNSVTDFCSKDATLH
jgi:predicted ABC-type transport system involved in lysophospholipase L1 biosynthesis ATPase subunit